MPYVYRDIGVEVKVGDKGKDFRGDEFEVLEMYPPGTNTGRFGGRIMLKYPDHANLYFPGVAGAEWKS